VPIPADLAAEGAEIEAATQRALAEAEEGGIRGAAITPFLLDRIRELTGGRSLEANIGLIKNNARVGAEIAVHLAELRKA
jgi:pseudouridylate synthase